MGYESWLERDRLILLDRDPEVVGIASQPFWLHWHDGKRWRRHASDFFVRLGDGRGRRPDRPGGRRVVRETERACQAVDWEFVRVGEPDPVLMANVRWLSRYRRRRCARADVAERLLRVFEEPAQLRPATEEVGDPRLVLPVLFHLLWSGVLSADLEGGPLSSDSLVVTTRGER